MRGKSARCPALFCSDEAFLEEFFAKAHQLKGARLRKALETLGHTKKGELVQDEVNLGKLTESSGVPLDADLAWHARAWGRKVLAEARKELAVLYPTYADWQSLAPGQPFEPQLMRLIQPDANGVASADELNAELSSDYLHNRRNPRWVAKPTAGYLWARTVRCKNCRATIPLLKSTWLFKKSDKRIRLVLEPNSKNTGVEFSIDYHVPERGGNAAQKREIDKKLGAGTMSRAGAKCPCCPAIMETEDIRYEGRNGRLGQVMTAVVVSGPDGKEYRLPTGEERAAGNVSRNEALERVFELLPFGLPQESMPPKEALGFRAPLYGIDRWDKAFFSRQLITIGTLAVLIRKAGLELREHSHTTDWTEAIVAFLACCLDKVCDYNSALVPWQTKSGKGSNTFSRWALPMKWDVVENAILDSDSGGFVSVLDWVTCPLYETLFPAALDQPGPHVQLGSSITSIHGEFDAIITDPPYYDAIPYSDLMDFFYVWLRRLVGDFSPAYAEAFREPLGPKWDEESNDGELIDESSRHSNDKEKSKKAYEDGMAKVFSGVPCSTSNKMGDS